MRALFKCCGPSRASKIKFKDEFDVFEYPKEDEDELGRVDGDIGRPSLRHRASDAREVRGTAVVELFKKEGSGLGLVISGGTDKDDRPRVSYLRPGGIAHRSDVLEVGDYIISVNGIRTSLLQHEQIVSLLKHAGDRIMLEVEYELPEPPQTTFSVLCKRVEVCLEKDGNSFGFTVRGGAHPDLIKARPLTITSLRPGSSADREGTLKVGDRILSINSANVTESPLHEAMQLLKRATKQVLLSIEYDVSVMEAVQNASGPLLVEIDKTPGTSLGISLASAKHHGQNIIVINKIKPASIADRCGALHIGDQILSIDDTGLEHMTVAEAIQLLKCSSGEQIRLEILPVGQTKTTKATIENQRRGDYLGVASSVPSSVDSVASARSFDSFHSMATRCGSAMGGLNGFDTLNSHTGTIKSNHTGTLRRERKFSSSDDRGSPTSASTVPPTFIAGHQVCHTETTEVILKADHRGFGFTLQDSPFSTDGLAEPPIIGHIEARGIAEKCGVLQEGDRVLAINDNDLENKTLIEAEQILTEAGSKVQLLIEFDVADSVVPSSGIFNVKLAKKGGGLGIIIGSTATRQLGEPLIISDVIKGGIAHRTGTMQAGDRLLSIDNLRTHKCQLEEACQALEKTGDIVRLRIQRDESDSDEPDPTTTVTYTVELDKHGGPLGITISGTEDPLDPILISGLSECGLAEKTGALHIGDRILAINSTGLQDRPLSDAIHLLQTSGDIVTIKIARSIDFRGRIMPAKSKEYVDEYTEKFDGTPIQSVDSALESWDSSGLDSNNAHGKNGHGSKTHLCNGRESPSNSHRSSHSSDHMTHNSDKVSNSSKESSGQKSNSEKGSSRASSEHKSQNRKSPISETEIKEDFASDAHRKMGNGAIPKKHGHDTNHLTVDEWDRHSSHSLHSNPSNPSNNTHMHNGLPSPHLTPSSSINGDIWSDDLDAQLDELLSAHSDFLETGSVFSDGPIERRVARDRVPRDARSASPDGQLSTSTKLAAEEHLREVEEQMQNIFRPTPLELHRMVLTRRRDEDFGFGMSDGVYEKGVYISAVRPGGPADRCRNLRPFDRLLQVNDTRTKDLECSQVVPLIARSGADIELVISRNPLAEYDDDEEILSGATDIWRPNTTGSRTNSTSSSRGSSQARITQRRV